MKKNIQLFLSGSFFIFTILGCSFNSNSKIQENTYIVANQYFNKDFLRNWNNATLKNLRQQGYNEKSPEIRALLDDVANHNLTTTGATRSNLVKFLSDNLGKDSIGFNTIFIIETKLSGEYVSYRDYLIFYTNNYCYFYALKSNLGNWDLNKTGKVKGLSDEELNQIVQYDYNFEAKATGNDPVIITKITSDSIISTTIQEPSEHEENLLTVFLKKLLK
jgi:hypothetical protein